MPFPVSFNGSFEVKVPGAPEDQIGPLKSALENWLRENRARLIYEREHGVGFRGGMFRAADSLNILVPYYGEIDVTPRSTSICVNYRLRFTDILIVVTSIVALWFTVGILTSANLYSSQALAPPAFIWLSLFGANYVISCWRIPRALKKLVRDVAGEEALPATGS